MKPTATVAAVVSGLTMFAAGLVLAGTSVFGARAAADEALSAIPDAPAISAPLAEAETFRQPRAPRPQRVSRTVSAPASYPAERVVLAEQPAPTRSWKKTAVIVGGSAASGAAVGAIVDGKKGALIGAAIGGGAASVYEVIRRR
jgi:hypothetical protein